MKMPDAEPTFFLASNLMDLLKWADPVKCISAHGHSSNGATMKSMRRCYNIKIIISEKELIFGFEILQVNFLYLEGYLWSDSRQTTVPIQLFHILQA